MLDNSLLSLYSFLRLSHYQRLFSTISERSGSLTATEAFSAEVIYLLDNPTIKEFASFVGISLPNANYKIAALIEKRYIEKIPSPTDRRESLLAVTDKFLNYYGGESGYISEASETIKGALSPGELATLETLLEKAMSNKE